MRSESQRLEPPPGGASLATVAVELLSRGPKPVELADGARRAIALRLAGIYRLGLRQLEIADAGSGPLADELERALRTEMADGMLASRQTAEVLQAMHAAGIRPVVLKGWSLAERHWPQPWMRPPGDVDLLVEEEALGEAIGALARLGLRPSQAEAPGRWRPAPSGIELWRGGPGASVDLHTRLFRTVGSGLGASEVLARATPSTLLGVPVRLLAPADEILFLLVHAAKHGAVRPKWMLDLHALRLAHPPELWAEAVERAIACHARRPAWAAARLLGRRSPLSAAAQRALRPALLPRAVIPFLVRASGSGRHLAFVPRPHYSLEWFLEDRAAQRFKRLLGVMERIFFPRPRSPSPESRSRRWLEATLRRGDGAQWVTVEGSSMAPSLRPGDQVLAAPIRAGETLREGDLLLARRAGILVVHRLVRKLEDRIVTRGDSARSDDSAIAERDILARVIDVRRGVAHEREETG